MTTPTTFFHKRRLRRPATPRKALVAAGLAASLILHGLLVAPILCAGAKRQKTRVPHVQGSSASQHNPVPRESMMVLFMDDDSSAIRDTSEDESESYHFLLPPQALIPASRPQISAENLALKDEEDGVPPTEANGDQSGRSMLFGRYMGQISARVERTWMRPRSAPTGGEFACRVQITQDQRGVVLEITLQKCTSDMRWQMSLVRAINAASPLPASPDPGVFSNMLTMEFDSNPYIEGGSDDGFEPIARSDLTHSNSCQPFRLYPSGVGADCVPTGRSTSPSSDHRHPVNNLRETSPHPS